MKNERPKTWLGSVLSFGGAKLTTLLTLGGRLPAKSPEGQQLEKREKEAPVIPPARRQRRKEAKPTRTQRRRLKQQRQRRRKKYLNALVVALGIVASLVGIYAFAAPRISVSSSTSLNPADPFSAPFIVSNDGYLAAYDVEHSCYHDKVQHSEQVSVENINVIGGDDLGLIGDLGPMERATVRCTMVFNNAPTVGANITINLSFRPSLYPLKITKRYRFVTARDSTGQLRWVHQPLGK